jgi:hypothetical protein
MGTLSVAANGRTVPVMEITEGPYRVEVRISPPTPRVGNLHLTLVLWTVDRRVPVTDALVTVRAVGPPPESLSVGPLEAYTIPPTLNWYDLNTALPQKGEWGFMVDITEGDRLTNVEFSLTAQSGTVDWGLIIVLISGIPLLVAVAWYVRRSVRRGSPRRKTLRRMR